MLARIEKTALYQQNCEAAKNKMNSDNLNNIDKSGASNDDVKNTSSPTVSTPRNNSRQKKLDRAADLVSARKRNVVVGRESWPTDHASSRYNTTVADIETDANEYAPPSPNGGFL